MRAARDAPLFLRLFDRRDFSLVMFGFFFFIFARIGLHPVQETCQNLGRFSTLIFLVFFSPSSPHKPMVRQVRKSTKKNPSSFPLLLPKFSPPSESKLEKKKSHLSPLVRTPMLPIVSLALRSLIHCWILLSLSLACTGTRRKVGAMCR